MPFQVKALQDNYFISHLIEVLLHDGPSNENPSSKQTSSLTEDPDCNTISSSYDLEYSESLDLESLSSHHKGESKLNSVDYEACGHQHQLTDNVSEGTYSSQGSRTLLCSNHSGKETENHNQIREYQVDKLFIQKCGESLFWEAFVLEERSSTRFKDNRQYIIVHANNVSFSNLERLSRTLRSLLKSARKSDGSESIKSDCPVYFVHMSRTRMFKLGFGNAESSKLAFQVSCLGHIKQMRWHECPVW